MDHGIKSEWQGEVDLARDKITIYTKHVCPRNSLSCVDCSFDGCFLYHSKNRTLFNVLSLVPLINS